MRDKLNQFVENLNGQFVEVSSKSALYQCMDLAYTWVFCLDIPKATIQNTYAFEVFTKPKPITLEYFDLIPNTPSGFPIDGDIVVWKGGEAGHIAVALSGSTKDKLLIFEQNNPLGTNAHIQERGYTNVLGWLRPKVVSESDPLKWLKGMFLELGVDLNKAEGEIRARIQEVIDGYKKYGELEKRLQKAEKDLAGANAEAADFETRLGTAEGTVSRLNTETADLRASVASRDTEINSLKTQLESLIEQINPNKVVMVPKEEYLKLLEAKKKMLEAAKFVELLKALFKKIFRR